jgi:hypothetical protein
MYWINCWIASLSFVFVLAFGANASAQIQLVAHGRQLNSFGSATSSTGSDSDSETSTAPDSGPWNDLVGIAVRAGTSTADGFASQDSSIGANQIRGELTTDAFVGILGEENDTASSGSSAYLEVLFQVATPSLYNLNISGYFSNNGMGYLILDEYLPIGSSLVYFDLVDQSSFVETVSLVPAQQYRLIVDVSSSGLLDFSGGFPDGRSGITFSLTRVVPEPRTYGFLLIATALSLLNRPRFQLRGCA